MVASRARGKLEAALARFALAGAVRGARAVDVGAGAGGFTESLLAAGAAHVLAVDVGHAQLRPSLRADPRVTLLERTDWRRLSLSAAEGPFDFFTVDVSFVAARNMLRGLAFRLRPGAEGVILVKPQFELADKQVEAGDVTDPNLRRVAVDKIRRRAESLGFALGGVIDSPVPGGSGTIELLAHLRFAGRPRTLPRPGERLPKPARTGARPLRAPGPDAPLDWFAVVAPGLEDVAANEIAALPDASGARVTLGGVAWTGPRLSGLRANLWLRIATRVLVRAGDVDAREFGQLRRRAARLPWGAFVPPGATLAVRAAASRCRLYHTGALAETAALAVADAVAGARPAGDGDDADVTILVRGAEDRFTFSVDASGERLHRRGARVETGEAPLRETLAAGLLALAGWSPREPLVDPMCGAGTLAIEACAQALGRAPGLDRRFAIETWPLLADATDAIASLRADASDRLHAPPPAPIVASDRDPRAIESARRNAARGGVDTHLVLACRDVADARPPADAAPGLVVANPPYGRRLGDARSAARAYRDLGRTLRAHFRGWRAGVVLPARLDAERALGLRSTARFALRNGGLPITFAVYPI